MATYRAYLIDEADHIQSARVIDAESDSDALAQAKQWVDGCDVEVWKGNQMVARLSQHAR